MNEVRYEWDTKEGKYLPATGRPGANTIVWTGYEWIPGEPNPEGPGAVSRGLSTGFESLKGLTTEVAPALVQSALGFDEAAQANLQQYRERMEKLQAEGRGTRVGLKDISDFSSALSFVGETLGETVTNLLPVGGLAAAGAKVAAKTAVADLAKGRVAAKAAQVMAQNPGKYTAMEAGDIATKAVATELGIAAGAGLGSFALNVPETFQNIYTETGEMRPGLATAIGTVKAALDTYTPVSLINKVRGAEFADRLSTNITAQLFKDRPGAAGAVSGLLSAAAKEGLTEGTQQFLDEATVSALKDSSIDWEKIAESALKGAIGGGAMGAPAGYLQGRREAAAIAQRQVGEQAQAEAQTQAQLDADQFTQLGATTPAQAPRTDEEIRANVYNTVAAAYPGIRISPEGQISTQDVRREAIARVQRGEAKSVTEEERRLKKEIGQRLSVAVGEAETQARMRAVGMLPQEEPGTTAAMREGLRQQELQRLRSLASQDIEGLPPVYQQEILEARRRLQEEEDGEAQVQGLTEGFPPRPEPLLLPPPQTYEVPGQPPLTRDQVYKMVDAAIAGGRRDLVPLRNLETQDEPSKIQNLIAAYTNPDITQAQIGGEAVDIITPGAARTQEQYRQDIADQRQDFTDKVFEANEALAKKYPKGPTPSPLEAASQYAFDLPRGARLNQNILAKHLRESGFAKIPRQDIAQMESLIRKAHPETFSKGVKVATPAKPGPSPEAVQTPESPLPSLAEMAKPKLNLPQDAPKEIVDNAEKLVEDSKQTSDAKDLLDKPYTCRT